MDGLQQELAILKAEVTAATKRLDKIEDITAQIHKLAANIENMGNDIKRLIESTEDRARSQGARLGGVEACMNVLKIREEQDREALADLDARIKAIETKGSRHLESALGAAVAAIVTAIIMWFFV